MKPGSVKLIDPYQLNRQLGNAFVWLRSNKYFKTAAELAITWGLAKSTVSDYLSCKRVLGIKNAARFNDRILKQHQLTLKDFESTILVEQAKMVKKPSPTEIAALLTTKLLVVENGQELVMEKLDKIIGELHKLREEVTKLKTGASS